MTVPSVVRPEAAGAVTVRALLERYAALAGAGVVEVEPELVELALPEAEAGYFRGARSLKVAFSVDALERAPDAEMAVVGSAFLQQLVEAIRARGDRRSLGLLPPTIAAEAAAAPLAVPLRGATAGEPTVETALQPLGRLVARVLLSAGSTVAEHMVESAVFDLAEGAPAPAELAALFQDAAAGRLTTSAPASANGARAVPPRAAEALVPLMLGDLEAQLAGEIDRRRQESRRALAAELARIDGYYRSLLEGPAGPNTDVPTGDARRAIEAEHARRRTEEERRHEVRATVHPLQLTELSTLVQRAEWRLATPAGRSGSVSARRALVGSGAWTMSCPTCGASPSALLVCRHDHVGCAACAHECGVCAEGFCRDHGIAACHVDGAPACSAHARRCGSCRRPHCTAHEGVCAEGEHPACTSCLAPCGRCGRTICAAHATRTAAGAPRGARVLCADCTVCCEGGTNEPVGLDEVVRCASCSRYVCEAHQVRCAVDQQVHCSTHLRRSDRTRRLLCEAHRASCSLEPGTIFAADEVQPCATCGATHCDTHGGPCAGDGRRHCAAHLAPLADRLGDQACPEHRSTCHVDGRAYTVDGTAPCPVCRRLACAEHTKPCGSCGRAVCSADRDAPTGRCAACRALAPTAEPGDDLLAAAIHANGGEVPSVKSWRTARDATHTIVEADLGWTRRMVLSVPHGDRVPQTVMRHSLLGAKRA